MKKVIAIILAVIFVLSVGTTAFAAQIIPSVEEKDAPTVVAPTDKTQADTAAVIVDTDYKVIKEVPGTKLIVTGVAHVDTSKEIPVEAKEDLKAAYTQLSNPKNKLSKIIPAMNDVVKKALGNDKNADNLIVRDLFDVSLVCEESNKLLLDEEHRLVVTFNIGVKKDQFVTAMKFNTTTDAWETIYKVTNNGDGTVTCEFDHLCPIAFLVEGGNAAQTGDNSVSLYVWIAIAAAAAGAMVVLFVIKNKKEKTAE